MHLLWALPKGESATLGCRDSQKVCPRPAHQHIAVVSSTGSARSFKDFGRGGAPYHCVLGCDVTRLSTKHAKHNNIIIHMHMPSFNLEEIQR